MSAECSLNVPQALYRTSARRAVFIIAIALFLVLLVQECKDQFIAHLTASVTTTAVAVLIVVFLLVREQTWGRAGNEDVHKHVESANSLPIPADVALLSL
jgi:uncharacterized membrane protein